MASEQAALEAAISRLVCQDWLPGEDPPKAHCGVCPDCVAIRHLSLALSVECAYCTGAILGHSAMCPVRLYPERVTLQAPSEHLLGPSRGPLLVPGTPAEKWIATCGCGWAGNPRVSVIEAKGDHTGHLSAVTAT